MSTIAERRRHKLLLRQEAAPMTTPSLTATAERNVMFAENQVHKLFLRYAETISEPERNDFFDSRNRDLWVSEFGRWLVEHQRKQIETFGASND